MSKSKIQGELWGITIQFSQVFIENFEITQDSSKPLAPKTSSGWDYEIQKEWAGF